ncbi:hypothetical protein F5H01DRAFT_326906 [Linnemannia elongata]|nr:hypothetical protein F5H01DRAFT_326906 [Linnemannia elongata]
MSRINHVPTSLPLLLVAQLLLVQVCATLPAPAPAPEVLSSASDTLPPDAQAYINSLNAFVADTGNNDKTAASSFLFGFLLPTLYYCYATNMKLQLPLDRRTEIQVASGIMPSDTNHDIQP